MGVVPVQTNRSEWTYMNEQEPPPGLIKGTYTESEQPSGVTGAGSTTISCQVFIKPRPGGWTFLHDPKGSEMNWWKIFIRGKTSHSLTKIRRVP